MGKPRLPGSARPKKKTEFERRLDALAGYVARASVGDALQVKGAGTKENCKRRKGNCVTTYC